jgi:Protein of unknown function (DUF2971)
MKLYKYCDKKGADILKNKRLKISKINGLNDPFELKAAVDTSYSYESILDDITDDVEAQTKLMDAFIEAGRYLNDYKSGFLEWYKQNGHNHLDFIKDACGEGMKTAINIMYEYSCNKFRFLCFSACPDSILMWSHYGKNHTGMLFKFETDKFIFNDVEDKYSVEDIIHKVEYSNERVKLPPSISFKDDKIYTALLPLCKRKHYDWAYEKEYRLLFRYDQSEDKPYIDIASKSLEEVVLGMNCDSPTEKKVIKLLGQQEFSHVILKRAKMHPDLFSLTYESVNR